MESTAKPVETITRGRFEPYGRVIEFSPGCTEQFERIVTETESPWRVAVYRYSEKSARVLEKHPGSMETLEPLEGVTLLLVAPCSAPGSYAAFLLDKPVCLYKGIWHQLIAVTDTAAVKITENAEVSSEFYRFEEDIGLVAGAVPARRAGAGRESE